MLGANESCEKHSGIRSLAERAEICFLTLLCATSEYSSCLLNICSRGSLLEGCGYLRATKMCVWRFLLTDFGSFLLPPKTE